MICPRNLPAPLGTLLIAALLGGCIFPKLVGDGRDDDGTGTTSGSGSGSSDQAAGSSAAATGVEGSSGSTSGGAVDLTSGTETSGGIDTGVEFIMVSDGGIADPCFIWDQDCPAGEKCMPWADDGGEEWNYTRCSPLVEQPDALGEPCSVEGSATSGFDTCDLGAMCWNVDPETLEGTCVGLCGGPEQAPVCEEAGTSCQVLVEDVLILCLPTR